MDDVPHTVDRLALRPQKPIRHMAHIAGIRYRVYPVTGGWGVFAKTPGGQEQLVETLKTEAQAEQMVRKILDQNAGEDP